MLDDGSYCVVGIDYEVGKKLLEQEGSSKVQKYKGKWVNWSYGPTCSMSRIFQMMSVLLGDFHSQLFLTDIEKIVTFTYVIILVKP